MSLIQRRSFITGLIGLVSAPAIVRAASLMPIKAIPQTERVGLTLEMLVNMAEHQFDWCLHHHSDEVMYLLSDGYLREHQRLRA